MKKTMILSVPKLEGIKEGSFSSDWHEDSERPSLYRREARFAGVPQDEDWAERTFAAQVEKVKEEYTDHRQKP